MSQLINMVKIGEQDEMDEKLVLEKSEVNFSNISAYVYSIKGWEEKYPWLSSVDPYGTTWINSLQGPKVIQELKSLLKNVQNSNLKKEIENVIHFLSSLRSNTEFVKFIGD